jgi:endonuclease YncB( thermonuclease family)
MKKLILALVFCLSFPALAAKQKEGVTYEAKILKVSDGDTIVIAAPYLPAPIKPQLAVRIYGVDTPEKGWRGQCDKEKQMGEQASEFTKGMVKSGKQFHVILYGWDKFGGRVLGDILVDGVSVGESLIDNGLAREYYGEAKQSWCN